MKLPIIIDEHGDVLIFESIANAERGLETIDVKNGEYTAYDGNGNLLKLIIVKTEKPSILGSTKSHDIIKIIENEDITNDPGTLKKILIDFFKNTNIYDESDEAKKLDDLIDKATKFLGYTI